MFKFYSGLLGVALVGAASFGTSGTADAKSFSWSGCYLGINGGSISGDSRFDLAPSGNYLNPVAGGAPPNAAGGGAGGPDLTAVTHSYSDKDTAFAGGGQIGCNWQQGRLVFGLEGDFQWSDLERSATASYAAFTSPFAGPPFTIAPQTDRVTSTLDWFSTLRVRVGLTVTERLWVYVTGGVAIARTESDTEVAFGNAGAFGVYNNARHVGSNSKTKTTGVFGGGLEYAFGNNWSLKGEYLYFNMGSQSYTSPLVAPAGVAAGYSWSTRVKDSGIQVFRVGLNYKLW